jgi:integrase
MTIKARKRADGSTGYTAVIRLKREGKIIHQEAKTFSRRAPAVEWRNRRKVELENPGALLKATQGATSLDSLIEWYIDEFEKVSKWQRSKGQHLRLLRTFPIAQADALALTGPALVDHVRQRRAKGTGPSTVANDLVWIGVVLRAAKSVKGLAVNPAVVDEARDACRALRLIGKSRQRDRTPTYDELKALDEYFARQDNRSDIPMRIIMWFAVYTARREAEITRLMRADNEEDRRTGIVRDAKHPTAKEGNHRMFRYTLEGWAIASGQPESEDGRLFPYDPKSISARFTRACKVLGIDDLKFHDLRHEATTRLFEAGLTIPEVAAHTLHESWSVLKRYTHLVKRGKVYNAPFL